MPFRLFYREKNPPPPPPKPKPNPKISHTPPPKHQPNPSHLNSLKSSLQNNMICLYNLFKSLVCHNLHSTYSWYEQNQTCQPLEIINVLSDFMLPDGLPLFVLMFLLFFFGGHFYFF